MESVLLIWLPLAVGVIFISTSTQVGVGSWFLWFRGLSYNLRAIVCGIRIQKAPKELFAIPLPDTSMSWCPDQNLLVRVWPVRVWISSNVSSDIQHQNTGQEHSSSS